MRIGSISAVSLPAVFITVQTAALGIAPSLVQTATLLASTERFIQATAPMTASMSTLASSDAMTTRFGAMNSLRLTTSLMAGFGQWKPVTPSLWNETGNQGLQQADLDVPA